MSNNRKIDDTAVVKTMDKKFPMSGHPLFRERYGVYVDKFNQLAEILDSSGIDIMLLRDVVAAAEGVERLSYPEVYKLGFSDGHDKGFKAGSDSVGLIDELNRFLVQRGLIANEEAAATKASG